MPIKICAAGFINLFIRVLIYFLGFDGVLIRLYEKNHTKTPTWGNLEPKPSHPLPSSDVFLNIEVPADS